VGIDSTKPKNKEQDTGQFNAPVDLETNEFAYVPIKEPNSMFQGCVRDFREFIDPCRRLNLELPSRLWNENAHVDPDFLKLTYGDIDGRDPHNGKINRRGKPLRGIQENDLLVFYAGLQPNNPSLKFRGIVDALIGIYIVQESMPANKFIQHYPRDYNAHTRRQSNDTDVIVKAKEGKSGRLDRCIIIGNFRDRTHRVFPDLLIKWGDFTIANDGWIQRSPRYPEFKEPERFCDWFKKQLEENQINLIQRNN
jgi:hypothetical protein